MARKKKRKLNLFLVIVVIMILILIRFVEETGVDITPDDRYTVVKVIDGDTFELTGGDKVRLLSIDTPEKGELFYNEAKSFLKKSTYNKSVNLEYANTRRDRYGRLLAYVYSDSLFINKIILENGLGYLYLFKDTDRDRKETRVLLSAQKKAIEEKKGIWSIKINEESFYINKDGSYRLHRPGCNSVQKLIAGKYRTFSHRIDGFLEGMSPCRNCKP